MSADEFKSKKRNLTAGCSFVATFFESGDFRKPFSAPSVQSFVIWSINLGSVTMKPEWNVERVIPYCGA